MLASRRNENLQTLVKSLGVDIDHLETLNTALTHNSFNKKKKECIVNVNVSEFQRLEFFGDSILKFVMSEFLMTKCKNLHQGDLSKFCAYLVSEKVLAKIGKELNLEKYILAGKSEKKSLPTSIVADTLEAILAVIYYQCGLDKTRKFVLKHWIKYMDMGGASPSFEFENYKAILQEYTQGKQRGIPLYKTINEQGPDHNKVFEIAVILNNIELARGEGKSKKEASQDAAKVALNKLNLNH